MRLPELLHPDAGQYIAMPEWHLDCLTYPSGGRQEYTLYARTAAQSYVVVHAVAEAAFMFEPTRSGLCYRSSPQEAPPPTDAAMWLRDASLPQTHSLHSVVFRLHLVRLLALMRNICPRIPDEGSVLCIETIKDEHATLSMCVYDTQGTTALVYFGDTHGLAPNQGMRMCVPARSVWLLWELMALSAHTTDGYADVKLTTPRGRPGEVLHVRIDTVEPCVGSLMIGTGRMFNYLAMKK
jgi:hypothetical protein